MTRRSRYQEILEATETETQRARRLERKPRVQDVAQMIMDADEPARLRAENGRLRQLLTWCRARLKRDCYRTTLDTMLANIGADPDPEMQGRLVQSDPHAGWSPGREITDAQLEAACGVLFVFDQHDPRVDPKAAWGMLGEQYKPAIRARVRAVLEAGRRG